jgi:hypothetical protein
LLYVTLHQWVRLGFGPFMTITTLEEAEIIPGKNSDTRIKPLPLTNGHGRYNTELLRPNPNEHPGLLSVGEWPLPLQYIEPL